MDPDRRRLLVGLGVTAAGSVMAAFRASAEPTKAVEAGASGGLGLVLATADGSVGQTYSGPAWALPQWYRETLASPKRRIAIPGASERTYVATADDAGFRLAMGGVDGGVRRIATAFAVVLPVPIVLEGFDTVEHLSAMPADSLSLALEATGGLQGSGSVVATARGRGNRLLLRLGDPAATGAAADPEGLGTLAWLKEELNPYASGSTSGSIRVDRTDGAPRRRGQMEGARLTNAHKGRFWNSVRPDQMPHLSGRDLSLAWTASFDRSSASGAPHAQRTRYDVLLARTDCRPALVIGFDDAVMTQRTIALPELLARGLAATFYLPTALVDEGGGRGRLAWEHVRDLFAVGMDIQLDGTADDRAMTSRADPAAAIAELKSMRALTMERVPGADPRHFCYPNGYTDAATAAGRSDHRAYPGGPASGIRGSPVLAGLADTAALVPGMAVSGAGIPEGARIASVDDATRITLTAPLTAATAMVAIWDDSSPFFLDRLQDALRSDGTFLTGRTTVFDTFHSRFGLADRDFLMPAFSMSNGSTGRDDDRALAARIVGRIDAAIARKENIEFYVHGVQVDGTFITTPLTSWITVLDAIVARRDAGLIDVLTKAQWWARDGRASCPV